MPSINLTDLAVGARYQADNTDGDFDAGSFYIFFLNANGSVKESILHTKYSQEEDGEKFKALLLKGMKGRTGVKRNNTFTFATSSNTLTIKVNGEESGKIVSPVLCKALWTLYLTEKTPSKSARDKICQGVKSML